MKRILLFLLVFPLFLSHPNPAFAAGGCDVTTDIIPVDTNESAITLTIKYPGLNPDPNVKYWVKLNETTIRNQIGPRLVDSAPKEFTVSGNKEIKINEVDGIGFLIDPLFHTNGINFQAKNYTITVTTVGGLLGLLGGQTICSGGFTVEQASSGVSGSCTGIEFLNPDFRPGDRVVFRIEPVPQSGKRNVVVKRGGQFGNDITDKTVCKNASDLTDPAGYDIGTFDYGKLGYENYFLEVQSEGAFSISGCGANSKTVCYANFTICDDCKSPGKGQGGKPEAPSPVKCNGDSACLACVEDEKNPKGIPTPLGCVKTNPAGLVSFILKFLLYTSGGIAALLIIFGGYTMMTSQGNPEKLQGARETITSAVVGLLFIIFSLVLLEIIGVDILRIPGFGK